MDIVERLRESDNDTEYVSPIGNKRRPTLAWEAAAEIERLRCQVDIGQQVVNFGVGLMTTEQVGQWVGVRHFLEAGTEMYPPFPEEEEPPPTSNITGPLQRVRWMALLGLLRRNKS